MLLKQASIRPVNIFCSTLTFDNYGMVIYVTVINFFLPSFILAPLFIRWSHLTKQVPSLLNSISAENFPDKFLANLDPILHTYDFDLQRQRCKFLQRHG
jgi:hypothetical protein